MKRTLSILTSVLLVTTLTTVFLQCTKTDDIAQVDIENTIQSEDHLMHPGPDPVFMDYVNESSDLFRLDAPLATTPTWERYMYLDKTDTLYNSTQGRNTFSRYIRTYGFTGVYMYSTSGILSSRSNDTQFGSFMKLLSDSGVVYRGVANGGSTTFQSSGNVSRFNSSQTDPARRVNVANLELEWWNGASTWSAWNSTNQQIASGTIPLNDFYEGWYKNLGSTIDTVAARDQVRFSDRILLHCYQNGIPTYSYANARSTGATGGRLDIIAKGARQANKRIDLYIIISAESTAWGASYTFTGPALAAAYVGGATNPFLSIETQAYNNIFTGMTTFQKQWINFKGFVWFTKRYCYRAVPPR